MMVLKSLLHPGSSQAREFEDPPGLLEKTEFLLRDWVNMYHRYNRVYHVNLCSEILGL